MFSLTIKKTSKILTIGHLWGDHLHKGPVMWKAFPYRDVFMFFFKATFYFCLVVLIRIEDFTTPGQVTIYMTQLLGCYYAWSTSETHFTLKFRKFSRTYIINSVFSVIMTFFHSTRRSHYLWPVQNELTTAKLLRTNDISRDFLVSVGFPTLPQLLHIWCTINGD